MIHIYILWLYNKCSTSFLFTYYNIAFTSAKLVSIWKCEVHSEKGQLYRPWTWHIPDKWLHPNKTPVLQILFMISGRCQGLFMYALITGVKWFQCQLLCWIMMLVSQMLWGKSVTYRFMNRDQWEVWLTSITPKCKGQKSLEIQLC